MKLIEFEVTGGSKNLSIYRKKRAYFYVSIFFFNSNGMAMYTFVYKWLMKQRRDLNESIQSTESERLVESFRFSFFRYEVFR